MGLTPKTKAYDERWAEHEGKKDGSLTPPIPPMESPDAPPAIREVIHAGMTQLQMKWDEWKQKDRTLRAQVHDRALHLQQAMQNLDPPQTRLRDAEAQHQEERNRKAPPTDMRFELYFIACGIMALIELPFNEVVFRPAGESELMTTIFALGLGVSVVLCAHFVGVMTRLKHYAGAFISVVIAIAVIASIAWFRAVHMAQIHGLGTDPAATTNYHHHPAVGTGGQPIEWASLPTLLAYFSFNALLFVVMATLSYYVHDELVQHIFKCRAAVAKADAIHRAANKRFGQVKSDRINQHARILAQATAICDRVNQLIELYKVHNLRSRKDRTDAAHHYPRCFDTIACLQVPNQLQHLTWDDGPDTHTSFDAPKEITNGFPAYNETDTHDVVLLRPTPAATAERNGL